MNTLDYFINMILWPRLEEDVRLQTNLLTPSGNPSPILVLRYMNFREARLSLVSNRGCEMAR